MSNDGVAEGKTSAFERTWSESPVTAVVEAVAAVTGEDPTSMAPLHEAVDADALNDVLRDTEGVSVTFVYNGTMVTVRSDGTLQVAVDRSRTA